MHSARETLIDWGLSSVEADEVLTQRDGELRPLILDEVSKSFREMKGSDGVHTAVLGMDSVLEHLDSLK